MMKNLMKMKTKMKLHPDFGLKRIVATVCST